MILTKIKYLITALLLVGLLGCDSVTTSFTDGYSENPNNPTDAPGGKIFVAGQVGTITFLESHSARKASMFAQYFSGEDRQYGAIYAYNNTATDNDNGWILAYVSGLTNLRLARQKYQELQVVPQNQVAATQIVEAMLMGQVAALFGDVPFSQATKYDSTSTPTYDSQAEVYDSIDELLDNAISALSGNTSVPVYDDITTLGEDASKWLKVAYTLKARYLMHRGNYEEALIAAQNGIDANDSSEDMMVLHGSLQGRNQNLYYNFAVVQRAGYLQANDSHADQMLENGNNAKTDESARQAYFYSGGNNNRVLNTTDGFAADVAPFPLVTYLENQLIIAEAEARKGTPAGDQNAINALNNTRDYLDNKFGTDNYDALTLADFQAGGIYAGTSIQQHTFNWTYLGFISQIEGFNFLRRIDYQVDGLTPVTGSAFPERYVYPQNERDTNPNIPSPAPGLFDPTPMNQ